jgi:hypothetical protein
VLKVFDVLLASKRRFPPVIPNHGCCVGGPLAKNAPPGPNGCPGCVGRAKASIVELFGNIKIVLLPDPSM